MFRSVNIPVFDPSGCHVAMAVTNLTLRWRQILGVVENMSHYECTKCGHVANIFGNGGARRTAEEMELDFLGEAPSRDHMQCAWPIYPTAVKLRTSTLSSRHL